MRRSEKEITEKEVIESIVRKARVCRIALCLNDVPYVVPVNFGFARGCLYFHSAPAGKKIDILHRNNNVCFQVDVDAEVVMSETPCMCGTRYQSVIGNGKAFFVDDPREKKKALDVIMEHYGGRSGEYAPDSFERTVVLRVEIENMTGKASPGK